MELKHSLGSTVWIRSNQEVHPCRVDAVRVNASGQMCEVACLGGQNNTVPAFVDADECYRSKEELELKERQKVVSALRGRWSEIATLVEQTIEQAEGPRRFDISCPIHRELISVVSGTPDDWDTEIRSWLALHDECRPRISLSNQILKELQAQKYRVFVLPVRLHG